MVGCRLGFFRRGAGVYGLLALLFLSFLLCMYIGVCIYVYIYGLYICVYMHVYMYVCLFFGYMFVLASMLLVANMYIYI